MIVVLRNDICVTLDEKDAVTSGGIFLVQEKELVEGTVTQVGSGTLTSAGVLVPLEIKVGDKVFFNKKLATEVKTDNGKFYVLSESSVTYLER